MPLNNSDKDWELFGKTDPYYAVLTAPEYHGQLSDKTRERFFESGEQHMAKMFSIIREHLDPNFAPRSALDFGCGVGRLLLPLARRCDEVTGVDVSPSMLAEARRNCDATGAKGVKLVQGDDALSNVRGSFDFIHSYIVLQHIPAPRGEKIIQRLAALLAPNGVAMLHVTYDSGFASWRKRASYWARMNLPGAKALINLARGRRIETPTMQMNEYSVTRVLDILSRNGCREVYVRFSDHDGARGVLLFARKGEASVFL